jgi:hypothetical protein
VVVLSVIALWVLSTKAFSVWLHNQVVPEYPLVTARDLKVKSVQAVVVLGGGVVTGLPGGDQQLSKTSLERLRLGAQLARLEAEALWCELLQRFPNVTDWQLVGPVMQRAGKTIRGLERMPMRFGDRVAVAK